MASNYARALVVEKWILSNREWIENNRLTLTEITRHCDASLPFKVTRHNVTAVMDVVMPGYVGKTRRPLMEGKRNDVIFAQQLAFICKKLHIQPMPEIIAIASTPPSLTSTVSEKDVLFAVVNRPPAAGNEQHLEAKRAEKAVGA